MKIKRVDMERKEVIKTIFMLIPCIDMISHNINQLIYSYLLNYSMVQSPS